MRFTPFLSFFLLALLSVSSFAGAEPLPAASLAARDPPVGVPATGGGGGSEDGSDKLTHGTSQQPCPDFPGYYCPNGYGTKNRLCHPLLISSDLIDGGATR
jgi:hypothetical protein